MDSAVDKHRAEARLKGFGFRLHLRRGQCDTHRAPQEQREATERSIQGRVRCQQRFSVMIHHLEYDNLGHTDTKILARSMLQEQSRLGS
jgi:hypothetical protein